MLSRLINIKILKPLTQDMVAHLRANYSDKKEGFYIERFDDDYLAVYIDMADCDTIQTVIAILNNAVGSKYFAIGEAKYTPCPAR